MQMLEKWVQGVLMCVKQWRIFESHVDDTLRGHEILEIMIMMMMEYQMNKILMMIMMEHLILKTLMMMAMEHQIQKILMMIMIECQMMKMLDLVIQDLGHVNELQCELNDVRGKMLVTMIQKLL